MRLPLKVRIFNFFRNVFRVRPLESALASVTRGRPGDSLLAKLVPNPYQYRPNTIRRVKRNNVVMEVDISDYIGHWLYFGFEDRNMDTLFGLCRKDSIVIDVGTNVGWTLLNMASIARDGFVFGFEPDPFNFGKCEANVKLNHTSKVKLFPLGLSDSNSSVRMEVRTPSNRGGNRISQSTTGHTVNVVRLDDQKEVLSFGRVDLIKIDVEGHELQVLKGASQLLQHHHPVLFIELDDNNLRDQGHSASALVAFLLQNGYTSVVNAEDSTPLTASSDFTNCHYDIIAR